MELSRFLSSFNWLYSITTWKSNTIKCYLCDIGRQQAINYMMKIYAFKDRHCWMGCEVCLWQCCYMFQTKNAWKFPGGLSDPGENIGKYLSSTDWTHGKVLQMYSNRIECRFSLSILEWIHALRHVFCLMWASHTFL